MVNHFLKVRFRVTFNLFFQFFNNFPINGVNLRELLRIALSKLRKIIKYARQIERESPRSRRFLRKAAVAL
jgi:hypothetical protein